jgi:hypothetical protein
MKINYIVGAMVVVAVLGFFIFSSRKTDRVTQAPPSVVAGEVSSDFVTIGTVQQAAPAAQKKQLKDMPLNELSSSHIAGLESQRGNRQMIVFVDGSSTQLTPSLLAQLPEEVRYRFSYEHSE